MPHVTVAHGPTGNAVYQVGRKSFVFFRTPRPDAFDPDTGERYPDVIVFWVPSESDQQALVQDEGTPSFTPPHFNGHPSVLVRAGRIGELSRDELVEVVQDAWLAQASPRRRAGWLGEQEQEGRPPATRATASPARPPASVKRGSPRGWAASAGIATATAST